MATGYLIIFVIQLTLTKSQLIDVGPTLVVVETGHTLPEPLTWHTSEYDGESHIYTFGGWSSSNTPYTNISRFSPFSEDSRSEIVAHLSVGSLLGTVVFENNTGLFYHFGGGTGGGNNSDLVTRFDHKPGGGVEVIGQLPSAIWSHSTALHGSKAYSSEGTPTLYGYAAFDVDSYKASIVPFRADCSFLFTAGPMVSYNGLLYVFGQCWVFDSSIDWAWVKWNPNNGNYTYTNALSINVASFEAMKMVGSAPFYYILGSAVTENGRVQGLWEINLERESFIILPLQNFPGNWTTSYSEMGVVYVEGLHRIYFLGGCFGCTSGGPNILSDQVWYIQLPEIFSCEGKEDGFYPHPEDCSRYVGCFGEHPTFYECPQPMQFDPVTQTCRPSDEVDCEIK